MLDVVLTPRFKVVPHLDRLVQPLHRLLLHMMLQAVAQKMFSMIVRKRSSQ